MDPEQTSAPVHSVADARSLIEPSLLGAVGEKIVVLHLDGRRGLLALREYAGLASEAELPIRSVIEEALRLDARFLLLAHNHPSGDVEPSEQDLRVSRLLADTARALGIRLIDHLIFAGGDVRSLRDLGLL